MNAFPNSPAHAAAREVRAQIENIATALRQSSSAFDRRSISDRLACAVRALYAVIDTSFDAPAHQDGLVECGRALAEASQLLAGFVPPGGAAADPMLIEARAALDITHARIRRVTDEAVDLMLTRRESRRTGVLESPNARPFLASVAVPRLHAMARARVAPSLSVEPELSVVVRKQRAKPVPKPTSIEELRAAAAKQPAPEHDPGPEIPIAAPPSNVMASDGGIVRRLARDCLEDVAALRSLRKPISTETWLDQAPFEQRLLDNVDAFVALGEAALPSVTLFHAEAPAPDPSRGFAVALTLGCIEGTDTADVAISTMKHGAPEEIPGFVEGLILAPNLAIDSELVSLLDAPNAAHVAAAIDVLGARGSLPADAPERVLPRRHPQLTAKLAASLGRALPRTRAIAVLSALLDEEPSDELFGIACTSLLRRGEGAVRQRLRDAIHARGSRVAIATRLLALCGRRDDLNLLLDGLGLAPEVAVISALGRHGHPRSLGALVALLDSTDEEVGSAAAAALDFITNANLRETVLEPWSRGVVPPDGSAPPTRAVSRPVTDRLAWEKWCGAARRLDGSVKIRGGLPFTPAMIVDELASAPPARRKEAALELVIATGVGTRLMTTDWVARQQEQLSDLGAHVRSLGSTPGAWWFGGAVLTSR